ncbi:hypothetical protein MKW94_003506 [Papaver nudicaule]|uniref:No apical meristem-associated C-terminal domain-containing protein n=1 Tax=Papaver nudicaule TaxID=74823 RepID=A0AA41VLD5_PAPNU|nr:hypothetical protein [Papaver nudicaule]
MEIQTIEIKKVLKIEYVTSKRKINNSIEYLRVFKKPFTLDECYELYKHEPGFDYTKMTDEPPQPPPPLPPPRQPIIVEDVDNDDEREAGDLTNDTNDVETNKKKRGPGKKQLIAQKQAKYLEGTSSDSVDSFSETNEKLLAYYKEQEEVHSQQFKEENEMLGRIREDKMKEREEKLMMDDCTKLTPIAREWLQKKQQEIMEKNSKKQDRNV